MTSPAFLLQHGYQSQPRGWATNDDATRDYWIAQGYPVIPKNVLDNPTEYGMEYIFEGESNNWTSYWTDGETYHRQNDLTLDEWLNAPGVRVVDIPEKPGFTIEDVCKMYYEFVGVKNNIATPVEASFHTLKKLYSSRLRQNQSANICTDNISQTFNFDREWYNYMSYGDTVLIGKHSGWAWNKGNTDETRQWIPMFTGQYQQYPSFSAENTYRYRIGQDVSDNSYYGYDDHPHYEIARAAYLGYITEYSYQSDISYGDGWTAEYWDYVDIESDDRIRVTDHSQREVLYTHDVSLKPFKYGPELASDNSGITDAFFIQSGSRDLDGNVANLSRFIHPKEPLAAWNGYAAGATEFTYINSAFYSNEADYLDKRFVAMQTLYRGLNTSNESVPMAYLAHANYIKIPVTYWTTVVNGITFYNRRTGTQGIENVLNIEPVFGLFNF